MFNIEFSKNSKIDQNKIMDILTDYRNIYKFFPPQFKTRIIEDDGNVAILEETISISILRKKIIQRTIHKKLDQKTMQIEVLSGPAKGSIIKISLEKVNQQNKINIKVKMKLGLKYLILIRFIKKKYGVILNMLFNKIEGIAQLTMNEKWRDSTLDDGECLILSNDNFPKLKFYGWWYSELKNIFLDEIYKSIPVNGNIVVDIGANICDSAIYFVMRDAKHVIAVEPFPINYEMSKKNIAVNNLENRITILWAGVSNMSNQITINDSLENGYTSFRMKEDNSGTTIVKTITLQEIVEKYNIVNGILKLDCEGCEYDAILSSTSSILSRFKNIIIEYHNGYKELKQKLEDAGFIVTLQNNSNQVFGYIRAER